MSNQKKAKLSGVSDSPCVRNCCLDESDICLGCFRHLDEIKAWRDYSTKDKNKINKLCQQRKEDKKH